MRNRIRIITLLLALAVAPNGYSQTFRELMEQKKAELLGAGSGGAATSESEMPTEGQVQIAEKCGDWRIYLL